VANILDCVDGQLARLTGIKSKIGRILDGFAGEIWFALIYLGLAFRLSQAYDTVLFFIPAVISGLSHMMQANISDYYKTLHLYFESKEKGKEFQNKKQIIILKQTMETGLDRFLYAAYAVYTGIQEKTTPALQQLLGYLHTQYGEDFPQHIRLDFRQESNRLMKRLIDFMTFNGRTIVLFIVVLSGYVWVYFIYEIVILNIVLCVSVQKHEKLCNSIYDKIVGR
jgi:hypothetical protein